MPVEKLGGLVATVGLSVGLAAVLSACSQGESTAEDALPESSEQTAVVSRNEAIGEATDEEEDEAGDPAEEDPPPPAGTVVWIHDVEPPDLHLDRPTNRLPTTAWIREGLLDGLFGVDRALAYHPELLAGEPVVTVGDDETVAIDYRLRSGLRWSDGAPLTAEDVAYTHRILTEGCEVEADGSIVDGMADGCVYESSSRQGLELVTSFEVTSDEEFTVTLANFFADWRSLYRAVFAAHAYGDNAAEVNRRLEEMSGPDGPLPTSGPLQLSSWERGRSMTLIRNDDYHGSVSPDAANPGPTEIEAVRIDFVIDLESRVDALLSGRADVIMDQPAPSYDRLLEADVFTVASTPGTEFEHLGLNLLNPHLAQPGVREAAAYALDKEVVGDVYGRYAGQPAPARGLGNSYWLAHQSAYEDHQARYDGARVEAAGAALESAGYVLGTDGVYRHPTLGRLSLRVGTIGGDRLREELQGRLVEQLAAAGFEIDVDNVPGGTYFRERPFAEAALAASASGGSEGDPTIWDIAQFAWVGGPWPGGQSGAYRSGAAGNPYGFANPEFDVRANECDATVDDDERAACYNELDSYVTTLDQGEDGLFIIPLTQKPSLFGFSTARLTAVGVAVDSDWGGPLANVVDYRLAQVS